MAVTNMSATFNKLSIFVPCVYISRSSSTFAFGKLYMILDKRKKNALYIYIYIYIYICRNTGPILESKDIFQKKVQKGAKYSKIWAKMYKI